MNNTEIISENYNSYMGCSFSNIANLFLSVVIINALSISIIRTVLISKFEKEMYNNFFSGNGNVELSNSDFDNIKSYVSCNIKVDEYKSSNIHFNDGSQGKAYILSFYNSAEFDHALGIATIYIDENKEIVGFLDYYDFDSRPWGERSYTSEIISRSINIFSSRNAKPFKITYGLQAITPIYDVVRQKSFSTRS